MNRVGLLPDGRVVMLTRHSYTSARVSVGTETVGHVRTEQKARRDVGTTEFMNAKYGEPIARSLGFGSRDVFVALDGNHRRINHRDYDRIEAAAMAVAEAASAIAK